jgi:RNase P subunit RPR2
MKHFTVWQWTDFVRGLVEGEGARSSMEAHLSSRCPRCERIVNVLRAVTVTARAEAGYEPPERAIRYARAIYSLYQPEKISLPRLIARLVFDSGRAPLSAGMRAQSRLSRHTLYAAGSYYLDVQLEHQPGSGLISLTGQLADRNKPAASTAGLPVRLMERKSLVAGTLSNGFGEFHLECAPARNLRLQVPLPAVRKRLEVPLGDFYAGPIIAPATKRRAGGK